MQESFHLVKYKADENQLITFADDSSPRYITSSVLLDYDTIAGGDKFGNIFICRLPSEVSDEVDNPTGNRILWDTGLLNGAPNKLEQVVQFHVGEVVTSMVRSSLVPGGMEAIIYSTIMGRVSALVPFTSREDVDFYTHLEMYMRQEKPPLCGRDHLSYRSYFIPVKNVTDGDLCEQYASLPAEKQKSIAGDLDRTPAEVLKKLEDIRNRLL
jgi:splicing factor 3B subunit 3